MTTTDPNARNQGWFVPSILTDGIPEDRYVYRPKACATCGTTYTPKGMCSHWCSTDCMNAYIARRPRS